MDNVRPHLNVEKTCLDLWFNELWIPKKRKVYDALQTNLNLWPVCNILALYIKKHGFFDLYVESNMVLLASSWDIYILRLIHNGAHIMFPQIETLTPPYNYVKKELVAAARRKTGNKNTIPMAAFRFAPGVDYGEKLDVRDGGACEIVNAFSHCCEAPAANKPRTVFVDAILPGSDMRMPDFLSNEYVFGGVCKPNITPRLVIGPLFGFTDVYIDNGTHVLALMAAGVFKLWGIWPGIKENAETLSKFKCKAISEAQAKGAKNPDFVLHKAV